MDEGSGTFTEDVTINTNDGTLINAPQWVAGMNGFAINFDGVNDRVDCGPGSEMDMGTDDFSIATWVKMGPVQKTYPTIIAKGGGATYDEGYWVNFVNNRLRFYLSNGTTRLIATSNAISITDNNWYHIAITVDRSGNVDFYVDAVNVGTRDISSMNGQNITSSRSLTMGSWQSNGSTCFTGALDDMRLYHLVLTPAEIIILAGGEPPVNYPPVITEEASAAPNPVTLPAPASVHVGAQDPNDDALTYTWSKLTGPGTVSFVPNGTIASNVSSATFTTDGVYELQVEITDGEFFIYSSVEVTVLPAGSIADPIAYWPMDEDFGTTTEDVTVNTNDGTLINGTDWTPGISGSALSFDGVNDRVDCGTGAEMDMGTGDFSVSTWINMGPTQKTYPTIVAKGGGATYDEGYWVNFVNNRLRFYLSNGTTRLIATSNAISITDNNWYHIAITVDRSGNVDFYVDAVNVGTRDISSMDGQNITSSRSLTMGSWQSNTSTCFTGILDDMRLYNVALTPSEVSILYGLYSAFKNAPAGSVNTADLGLNVFPNPFNESVSIDFSLNEDEKVTIAIYNLNGEMIQLLQNGSMMEGKHRLLWDGRTQFGDDAPTGMYIVKIITSYSVDQKTLFVLSNAYN